MRNWNRLQNAADLRCVFYRCEDCACMLHIISLRAQISQNVKYWYEIIDVLVPILHSVNFAKCEICGSTALYGLTLQKGIYKSNNANKFHVPSFRYMYLTQMHAHFYSTCTCIYDLPIFPHQIRNIPLYTENM